VVFGALFLVWTSAFLLTFTIDATEGKLHGGNSVFNPAIWVPLIAVVVSASVFAKGVAQSKNEERVHGIRVGPTLNGFVSLDGPPSPAESITWAANPKLGPTRRYRWYGLALIPPTAVWIALLALLRLPLDSWGELILTLCAMFFGVFAAAFLVTSWLQVRRMPLRWGTSSSGLYVEYPITAPARPLRYIAWSDVTEFNSHPVRGANWTTVVTRLGWETYWGIPSAMVEAAQARINASRSNVSLPLP
jgi:hypothetical protein